IIRKAMVFRQVADLVTDGHGSRRPLQQLRVTFGRPDDAEENLDERCLAGAIATQEAIDLAALDGNGNATQRFHGAILFGQRIGADDGHIRLFALKPSHLTEYHLFFMIFPLLFQKRSLGCLTAAAAQSTLARAPVDCGFAARSSRMSDNSLSLSIVRATFD